jgi:NAD(P)-dependent dehydrogenase (short-subunit alcohol dehydrogenase family)
MKTMSQRFVGKRVLLTGGASGIGRATAERLAAEGATVMIGDIAIEGARAVAEAIGGHALAYDSRDPQSAQALAEAAAQAMGGIDVLANIAGVMSWGRLEEIDVGTWERTLDINLTGPFHLIRAALPFLQKTKGNIVSVASAGGLHPVYGTAAYGVSKAGVIALTKAASLEFARHGIRVNAVAPGGVMTPMHEKSMADGGFDQDILAEAAGRNMPKLTDRPACTPEEIAAAIAYLASDEARFATGTVLVIDGGQTTG